MDPTDVPELGELLEKQGSLDFLGEEIDKDIAKKVCLGELNPITRECFRQIVPITDNEGNKQG